MWEKQMYELLDKLSQINYEELDIDDFLDQRDTDPFDIEWVRVYQALEELKKGKTVADTREIEKKAYITSTKNRRMMSWQGTSLTTLD